MYKLPKEIKKVVIISLIVASIISGVILIFNPFYALCFVLGYIASLFSLLKNNIIITAMLYRNISSSINVISNLLSYAIYAAVLMVGFTRGLFPGLIGICGVFIIKIIIVILYGCNRKEGD